jgi:hypothetical protein
MTAHPAWPQSVYDQNRAGLSARLRGAQLRPLRVVDTKSGGPVGAVNENQEGSLICILRPRRSSLSAAVPA